MRNRLRIFNTLTRKVVPFRSLSPGRVNMLVCGPTIQDFIHVGHARTYLFYDMVARYLSFLGFRTTFVLNVTDIDEGITKGAKSAEVSLSRFTSKYERAFRSDMRKLGIGTVSAYERVSRFIPEMTSQIRGLMAGGSAYKVGANIYFSVDTFPTFGRLSNQSPEEISLHPLEIAEGKRNQADFSLWREGVESEQKWESPWGKGIPGWHIQDTAVSSSHYGGQYDIHGGARELVYPHHEAVIAQMESLHGVRPAVKYWLHSGLLTQGKEKMAKSRGNAPRVREVLKDHGVGGLRLYLLSMHHREDIEFSEAALVKWEEAFEKLQSLSKKVEDRGEGMPGRLDPSDPFFEAMNDDLRSKEAIEHLLGVARKASEDRERDKAGNALLLLRTASEIMGIGIFEKVK